MAKSNREGYSQMTVQWPEDQYNLIKETAKANGYNIASFVRSAVVDKLNKLGAERKAAV